MAIVSVEASSSISNSIRPWKYHVFLSFRGEDTRKNFCDHLYAALKHKGIRAFRDNEELRRGKVISQELIRAIEDSLFSIVILSKNYASSTWCLDELEKILDSKKELGRTVVPVFYGVDPSDVRHQRGSFAEAFKEHEKKFKNNIEKVQKWRDALKEVAGISGWDSGNWYEADLVQSILKEIWIELPMKFSPSFDNLVGINSKIKEIYKLLELSLKDVRLIGIWGMGGIGKTTIARVVYESIRSEFEIHDFFLNVREAHERHGLIHLQKKLLSRLHGRDFNIHNEFDGMKITREIFCNKKVLLILDDVSEKIQLEYLAVKQEWFGPGSRVIITTRDMHLLTTHGFQKYEVQTLSDDESLQLLCQKAFHKEQPEEGFLELSNGVVKYAGGLPLALEVLGTFLYKRSVPEWLDTLDKLKQNKQDDIFKALKISYDGLDDEELRTIFLDIACFFNWENTNKITHILESCGLHPTIGIKVLVEKALLIDEGGILHMHDLLEEMGKNIVLQKSPDDPSRRSRLWSLEDINKVLGGDKGAKDIQGIVLELQEPFEKEWHPDCFSKMCNLRLLKVNNMHRVNGIESINSALKVLRWERFPLETLPNNVKFDELVDLKMCHSKIRQFSNEAQVFGKLKFINLSHCNNLIKTPNFDRIPNLEILILESCISIVEVHPSLAQHKKLAIVNLRDCKSLETLPSKLELNSLEELIFSGCTKVRELPEFGENMERLRTLDVSGTAISELPLSIHLLKSLEHLNLAGCQELSSNSWSKLNLPFGTMFGLTKIPLALKNLTRLDLSYCNLHDETFPNDFSWAPSLRDLDLSGNNFINLPAHCMSKLLMLERLRLSCCQNLQCLPQLPPNLQCVDADNCRSMGRLLKPQQLSNLFTSILCQNRNLHCEEYIGKTSEWGLRLLIPGSEIPPWFHNREFSLMDPSDLGPDMSFAGLIRMLLGESSLYCDSVISIIVDIPDVCHPSEWSGIAVCLVLQEPIHHPPMPCWFTVGWIFNSPEDEIERNRSWVLDLKYDEPQPQLFMVLFPLDYHNCWRHLVGACRQLRLIMYSDKLLIKACGWCLLTKEDLQRMSSNNSGIHITEIVNDK